LASEVKVTVEFQDLTYTNADEKKNELSKSQTKRSRTMPLNETSVQRRPPVVRVKEHQIPECDEGDWIEFIAKKVGEIAIGSRAGCFYLNPLFTVSASWFSAEFSRKARKCQANWYRRVDQALQRKHRKRRERELDFWSRQAAYTGILIIEGQPVPPHEWTAMETNSKPFELKYSLSPR